MLSNDHRNDLMDWMGRRVREMVVEMAHHRRARDVAIGLHLVDRMASEVAARQMVGHTMDLHMNDRVARVVRRTGDSAINTNYSGWKS